jgi:heme exporter protein C
LFFIYLGVIALRQSIEDEAKAARASAILTLVGTINLPIIHFSVYWWNTLHQRSSLLREGGPSIAASMLWPLLIMMIAYVALFAAALILRMRTMIIRRRIKSSAVRAGSHAVIREADAHA